MLQREAWQQALTDLVTDPQELLTLLELDPALLPAAKNAASLFPLRVPRGFVSRMQKGNVNDPLLKQVLPLDAELQPVLGYELDPLQETTSNPVSGLLQKYHGRVLVTLTGVCAIHCRYCFRRHFPYADNNPGRAGWKALLSYINADTNIREVILSGGDPLAVSDKLLTSFSDELTKIPHLKYLRIHTRLPVVLPERITPSFIAWLDSIKLNKVIVLHINHAQEINDDVRAALKKLRDAGVQLLNQSVLLRGINDDVDTLCGLSEALFAVQVLPYYLHVLDKVDGAAHFDLERKRAKAIHAELTSRLSGYLVPRLVCEMAGANAKTVL